MEKEKMQRKLVKYNHKTNMKFIEKTILTEKGITLLALVITIVIMIILATITINMLFGDNGLVTKAIQAKEQIQIASRKGRN